MNILVTGGGGFIGSVVVSKLRHKGHTVMAPSREEIELLDDTSMTRYITSKYEETGNVPNVMVHMAATVGGIQYNMAHRASLLRNNLMVGFNAIDQAVRLGVDKIVYVGSACSYPGLAPVPTVESNLWRGYPDYSNAPYGIAKKVVGQYLIELFEENKISSAAYPILTNTYGPGDNFGRGSHVIPSLIRKFVEGKEDGKPEVTVWGTGNASRDMIYVSDAAEAICLCVEKVDCPDPINISSTQEVTISFIANTIKELTGYEGDIVFDDTKPDGQRRRMISSILAEKKLGWRPKTSILPGLVNTIDWYMENRENL